MSQVFKVRTTAAKSAQNRPGQKYNSLYYNQLGLQLYARDLIINLMYIETEAEVG